MIPCSLFQYSVRFCNLPGKSTLSCSIATCPECCPCSLSTGSADTAKQSSASSLHMYGASAKVQSRKSRVFPTPKDMERRCSPSNSRDRLALRIRSCNRPSIQFVLIATVQKRSSGFMNTSLTRSPHIVSVSLSYRYKQHARIANRVRRQSVLQTSFSLNPRSNFARRKAASAGARPILAASATAAGRSDAQSNSNPLLRCFAAWQQWWHIGATAKADLPKSQEFSQILLRLWGFIQHSTQTLAFALLFMVGMLPPSLTPVASVLNTTAS